jgi:DNA-directed RNA polymerase specialized sigma24 family protein
VRVEDLGRLARALEQLAPADRELVRLLFVENLAPGGVAERLGVAPGVLYTRKNRALERLRAAFLGIDGEG